MKKELPRTLPRAVITTFFVIGLVSALAFRALIVAAHVMPELFRPIWYVGVIGYVLFFLFRYSISRKRKRAIAAFGLIPKLDRGEALSGQDREVLVYLLSSITKSREDWNYLFIFALSLAAILIDVALSKGGF